MRLLELEFENFKSFKGHVTVPLGTGFTCITGPNGSGKSNITDAILFILGSRSTKLLRARRLSQLIYGYQEGKQRKSAAKHCRVSMLFDNSDRYLSIESDLVKFTKSVRLRGDKPVTSYRLNDEPSSASEFESLFSRAGLYATGYNIIQQGDVTQTSLMSGTERRHKLEDVAGITAYDQRLRKTRSAREHVGADLALLEERMREVQRLLRQLEREKRDAERLEAILLQLQENELLRHWRQVLDLEASLESRREVVIRYREELEELESELKERQATIGTLEHEYKNVEDDISAAGGDRARELQQQLDEARVAQALAQSNSEQAQKQLAELETMRKTLRTEHRAAAAELKVLRKSLDAARSETETLVEQAAENEAELAEREGAAASGSQEIEAQRATLDELRQAAGTLEMQRHRLEGEREQLELQLAQTREQAMGNEQLLVAAQADVDDVDFHLQDLQLGRKSAADNLRKVTRKYDKLNGELAQVSEALERAERELHETSVALAAEQAAQRTQDELGGYARAVQGVLAARDAGDLPGIVGTIAELGRVDEEHALALEVAAGGRMQSVVVEDDAAAGTAIKFLKQRRLGRVRFLPLNKLRRYRPRANALLLLKQPGAIGFAQELVQFDPRYADAFGNVFGDTVIMHSLREARTLLGKGRMVTLEGELLEPGGAMTGGSSPRARVHFATGDRATLDELATLVKVAQAHNLELGATASTLREEVAIVAQAKAALESECATIQTRVTDYDSTVSRSAEQLQQVADALEARPRGIDATQCFLGDREPLACVAGAIGDAVAVGEVLHHAHALRALAVARSVGELEERNAGFEVVSTLVAMQYPALHQPVAQEDLHPRFFEVVREGESFGNHRFGLLVPHVADGGRDVVDDRGEPMVPAFAQLFLLIVDPLPDVHASWTPWLPARVQTMCWRSASEASREGVPRRSSCAVSMPSTARSRRSASLRRVSSVQVSTAWTAGEARLT